MANDIHWPIPVITAAVLLVVGEMLVRIVISAAEAKVAIVVLIVVLVVVMAVDLTPFLRAQ